MITAYLVFNKSKIWVDGLWIWMPVGTTWTNISEADHCSLEASLQKAATFVTYLCNKSRGQEPLPLPPHTHTAWPAWNWCFLAETCKSSSHLAEKQAEDSERSNPSHKSVETSSILYPDHSSLSQAHWFCRAACKDHTLSSAKKPSQ